MPKQGPTSRDVARLAGVSRTTVSYVINRSDAGIAISPSTRDRVLEAARQLGYYPNASARSLRRQRTNVIGLLLRESSDRLTADAFLPQVIGGINDVCGQAGFKLLVEATDASASDRYDSLVREGYADGLILAGPHTLEDDPASPVHGFVPVVLWGRRPGVNLPFVDIDNVAAARMAVEHLVAHGHQRIGCITNAPPTAASPDATDRFAGYTMALGANGLPVDGSLTRYGRFDEQSGYEAMASLLAADERPTAVFIASDEVALGALKAARAAGVRVPQDLAVVSFDDIPTSEFVAPPLTSMRVPAREIGSEATRRLLEAMTTGSTASSTILPTELVLRESCGRH